MKESSEFTAQTTVHTSQGGRTPIVITHCEPDTMQYFSHLIDKEAEFWIK